MWYNICEIVFLIDTSWFSPDCENYLEHRVLLTFKMLLLYYVIYFRYFYHVGPPYCLLFWLPGRFLLQPLAIFLYLMQPWRSESHFLFSGWFNETYWNTKFIGYFCCGNIWWRRSNRQCSRVLWLASRRWNTVGWCQLYCKNSKGSMFLQDSQNHYSFEFVYTFLLYSLAFDYYSI